MSFVLEMENPLGGDKMEVPSKSTTYTTTRIKERPSETTGAGESQAEQEPVDEEDNISDLAATPEAPQQAAAPSGKETSSKMNDVACSRKYG